MCPKGPVNSSRPNIHTALAPAAPTLPWANRWSGNSWWKAAAIIIIILSTIITSSSQWSLMWQYCNWKCQSHCYLNQAPQETAQLQWSKWTKSTVTSKRSKLAHDRSSVKDIAGIQIPEQPPPWQQSRWKPEHMATSMGKTRPRNSSTHPVSIVSRQFESDFDKCQLRNKLRNEHAIECQKGEKTHQCDQPNQSWTQKHCQSSNHPVFMHGKCGETPYTMLQSTMVKNDCRQIKKTFILIGYREIKQHFIRQFPMT